MEQRGPGSLEAQGAETDVGDLRQELELGQVQHRMHGSGLGWLEWAWRGQHGPAQPQQAWLLTSEAWLLT